MCLGFKFITKHNILSRYIQRSMSFMQESILWRIPRRRRYFFWVWPAFSIFHFWKEKYLWASMNFHLIFITVYLFLHFIFSITYFLTHKWTECTFWIYSHCYILYLDYNLCMFFMFYTLQLVFFLSVFWFSLTTKLYVFPNFRKNRNVYV